MLIENCLLFIWSQMVFIRKTNNIMIKKFWLDFFIRNDRRNSENKNKNRSMVIFGKLTEAH